MKTKRIPAILVQALLLVMPSIGSAERVPDDRKDSTHVVVGVVTAVFRRETKEHDQYMVQIRVEKMEKGDDHKPGELFYAYCFQRRRGFPILPGLGGHKAVPKEGQRIRAFIHRKSGLNEGNYSDWFDVIQPPK